jgi:feruloyl-CoA synthase
VHVGALRLKAIAALDPVAQDVVITGHGRDEIGFLIVPQLDACRRLSSLPHDAATADVLRHPSVRHRVSRGLLALLQSGGGSSTHATRALFLDEPLSIDAGELTDKGYVNQRAVLRRRATLVEQLYDTPLGASVIPLPRAAEARDDGRP